jgi:uncharacterized protein YndB with AHSA1/START domain
MVNSIKIDPKLDLVFERTTHLAPEQIWKGWTDPETLKRWFCPLPWKVSDCKIDLHPGGQFYTLMQSPDGQEFPNHGIFLEVIENKKLVSTNAMIQGFRPVNCPPDGFLYTITLLFSISEKGTLYKAIVAHADEEGRKKHEQMNFQEGWGKAFDQLVDLYR